MKPEQIEKIVNATIKKYPVLHKGNPNWELFRKLVEATEQALLKVDGDLVDKIHGVIGELPIENPYTISENILSLISPHLQAAADKEREIEQLKCEHSQIEKGFIGVVMDCYDRMERLEKEIEESKAEDIQQAVQQERERIIRVIKSKLFNPANNSYQAAHNNLIDNLLDIFGVEEEINKNGQALEGKH